MVNPRENVGELMASGTWFTCDLLRLIAKADFANRVKLLRSFPDEVESYMLWYESDGKTTHGELHRAAHPELYDEVKADA